MTSQKRPLRPADDGELTRAMGADRRSDRLRLYSPKDPAWVRLAAHLLEQLPRIVVAIAAGSSLFAASPQVRGWPW